MAKNQNQSLPLSNFERAMHIVASADKSVVDSLIAQATKKKADENTLPHSGNKRKAKK